MTETRKPSELEVELRELSSKDGQLWSILTLVAAIVVMGFLALLMPDLLWRTGTLKINVSFLPQLFFGFIVLMALCNLYFLDQRRQLNRTRDRLIRKLIEKENSGSDLCDPLTKQFSKNYLDLLLPKEAARADREGKPIGLSMVSVCNHHEVESKFGEVASDHLLLVITQLLKSTLRGGDIISRHGSDEFLLVLRDTDARQTARVVGRIVQAVETWNCSTSFPYKLVVRAGVACYVRGESLEDVIAASRDYSQESWVRSDLHKERGHEGLMIGSEYLTTI